MRILVIPDLHGKNCWERLIKEFNPDLSVFEGDYMDSYDESEEAKNKIVGNLQNIIYYKKTYPEKCILLIGNHDASYMYYPKYRGSGFSFHKQAVTTELFLTNKELFQVAFQYDDYLFTHAGVTKQWFFKYFNVLGSYANLMEVNLHDNIADVLNTINNTRDQNILYEVGVTRDGDLGNRGGPIWADRTEIMAGIIPKYRQIVGHNKVADIHTMKSESCPGAECTFTDCLDTKENVVLLDIT